MLQAGDMAPDFTLQDQEGNSVTLSELRGRVVVLFFYPKADTPGCTKEAQGFGETDPMFRQADAVVLGISPDPIRKQQKFAEKLGLPFRLLADEGHATAESYGIWIEKTLYGRKYMGVDRTTYVIDPQGVIRRIFPKVHIEGHPDAVLEAVRELASGQTSAPA